MLLCLSSRPHEGLLLRVLWLLVQLKVKAIRVTAAVSL